MTRKEERINAIQNVGAVLFVTGLIICMSIDSVFVLMIAYAFACIGVLMIYLAEFIVNKLEQRQKNKDSHRPKH